MPSSTSPSSPGARRKVIEAVKPWNTETAWWVLAIFFERRGRIRWMRVLVALLMVVLGGVYIYSLLTQNSQAILFTSWLLVAVGLMLALYAAYVWNESRKQPLTAD